MRHLTACSAAQYANVQRLSIAGAKCSVLRQPLVEMWPPTPRLPVWQPCPCVLPSRTGPHAGARWQRQWQRAGHAQYGACPPPTAQPPPWRQCQRLHPPCPRSGANWPGPPPGSTTPASCMTMAMAVCKQPPSSLLQPHRQHPRLPRRQCPSPQQSVCAAAATAEGGRRRVS